MERVFMIAQCVQTHGALIAGVIYAFYLEEISGGRLRISAISGQTETYDSTLDFLCKFKDVTSLGEVEDQDEVARLAQGYKALVYWKQENLWA